MKHCLKCDYPNPDNRTTCYKCGVVLESPRQPAPTPPSAPVSTLAYLPPKLKQDAQSAVGCFVIVLAIVLGLMWIGRDDKPNRAAVETAFSSFQSSVTNSSGEAKRFFVSMELDTEQPTVRLRILPSVWYGVGEYDKRKVTTMLWEIWAGCLQDNGVDTKEGIVRLYDDTGTCVARGASWGADIYH